MSKRRLCLMLLLSLGFAGSAAGVHILRLPRQFLGSHTLGLLDDVQQVETFRLRSDVHDVERKQIRDYPLKYRGKAQGRQFAHLLVDVLRNPKTYWGSNDVTCIPDPGVAFRLWSGKGCVEVMLCFHCNQMLVTTKNEQGKVVHTAYTEFGSVRPELVALSKQAFPNDSEILSLK